MEAQQLAAALIRLMGNDPNANIFELMERKKAQLLEEAAAIERDIAEFAARIKAKYGLSDALLAPQVIDTPPAATMPAPKNDAPEVTTIGDLIHLYRTTEKSPYKGLSHASRGHYDALLDLIKGDYEHEKLAGLTAEHFLAWHKKWSEGGKKSIGYAKIGMVRGIVGFGTEVLHDGECARLFGIICKLKFKAPKGRNERLTAAQATAIRQKAHQLKRPSMALAQAFQFDVGLLQKDAIGEWVPLNEEGVSDITDTDKKLKWVRGIRWNEIDANLVLRHSSTWLGDIAFDLRKAPMVLEEFKRRFPGFNIERPSRDQLPATGPIIVSEQRKLPWTSPEFRRWWRQIADACNVPKTVRNSDSRPRIVNGSQQEQATQEQRIVK